MTDLETTFAVINRLCSNIQSEDRKKRNQALNELYNELFNKSQFEDSDSLVEIFNDIEKNIWKCLYDQSEAVRDSSISIVEELANKLPPNEKFLSELIPILLWRLGDKEVNEPSEEVRLRLVSLLDAVILKYNKFCGPFTGDVVQILTKMLVDSYPKIRQESCKCAGDLAVTVPRYFYDQSNKLVKPILQSFSHQHYRMRVAAIEALGKVVRWGSTKNLAIQEVFGSLAERLFDSTPAVRSAVTKVISDWLMNMHDRYSFFTKMVPLILTSLCDELPELREEAWELWCKAGLQYELENEQELKEKMDFLSEKPAHYPKNVERPNLGCRTLVQRNTIQITPALSKELEDWKNDIRIKSAQLLCWLVLHNETDITQHTENLLLIMYKVCNQTDYRIIENVEKAAEYIAYFVSPDTYMMLVVPIVQDVCTPGHICVLAALIRGTRPDLLTPHLESIGQLLSEDNICRNRNNAFHMQLLKCTEALLTNCKEACSKISSHLFVILVTIKALSTQQEIADSAQDLLEELSSKSGLEEVTELYKNHTEILLSKMQSTVRTWTSVSCDRFILQQLLQDAGPVIGLQLQRIFVILKDAMDADGDPLIRSKLFILMSSVLSRRDLTMSLASEEIYHKFLISFILEIVCPNLVWHAGRTAEALRTVVAASLCAAVLPQRESSALLDRDNPKVSEESKENMDYGCGLELATVEVIEEVFKNLFPVLITSVEDSASKTRLLSLKALQSLIVLAREKDLLSPDHVNQAYPVLLKRLDDVCPDVRETSVKCLTVLYSNLPTNYDPVSFRPHLESLFATMLIHLDDPDESFQNVMTDALKAVGRVTPKILHDKLDAIKDRFRNCRMCNELLSYLKSCHKPESAQA